MLNKALIHSVIPYSVGVEDNSFLCYALFETEINYMVFLLDANSPPGSNGFKGFFYLFRNANIVKVDKYFFQMGYIPTRVNSNFMVLLLKSNNADIIDQFLQ